MHEDRTIFLVDDDEDDRMLIREAITGVVHPIRLVDVPFVDQLPHLLDAAPAGPKLILMDMNMPRINGLEMLSHIKHEARYRHIPVVMISTTTNQSLISRAYNLGANAFIVKPVTLDEYEELARGVVLCFLNNYRWKSFGPSRDTGDGKTLVVVEDDDDHWFLFEAAIRNSTARYRIIRLTSKDSAEDFVTNELMKTVPPVDMILVDLYLPARKDGLELLSSLRGLMLARHVRNIPIIVFTYSDNTRDVDDCYREQANAYLVKPLDVDGWSFYFENLIHFWSTVVKPATPLKPGAQPPRKKE